MSNKMLTICALVAALSVPGCVSRQQNTPLETVSKPQSIVKYECACEKHSRLPDLLNPNYLIAHHDEDERVWELSDIKDSKNKFSGNVTRYMVLSNCKGKCRFVPVNHLEKITTIIPVMKLNNLGDKVPIDAPPGYKDLPMHYGDFAVFDFYLMPKVKE